MENKKEDINICARERAIDLISFFERSESDRLSIPYLMSLELKDLNGLAYYLLKGEAEACAAGGEPSAIRLHIGDIVFCEYHRRQLSDLYDELLEVAMSGGDPALH